MKRLALVLLAISFMACSVRADDRPIDFNKMPAAAQNFIRQYFPNDSVEYCTKDDDIFRPDYAVFLGSGVKIDFEHNGDLDKIKAVAGVPEVIIPSQIIEYVKLNYVGVTVVEYEVGDYDYEVKLSNGWELTFNKSFNLIELDD